MSCNDNFGQICRSMTIFFLYINKLDGAICVVKTRSNFLETGVKHGFWELRGSFEPSASTCCRLITVRTILWWLGMFGTT
jgi:hypothetical protein